MAWEVKWTEAAWNDLEEAADYIAHDSPHYAAAVVRESRDGARNLHAFWEREGRSPPGDII
jgi:plasmid stabilization system protein ParE